MFFKKNNTSCEISKTEAEQPASRSKPCRSFGKLNQWQMKQYRSAVLENKWFLGEKLERPTSWEEAEKDFLFNDFYGCAPKWRHEFCANRCNHFSACDLGKRFSLPKDA